METEKWYAYLRKVKRGAEWRALLPAVASLSLETCASSDWVLPTAANAQGS